MQDRKRYEDELLSLSGQLQNLSNAFYTTGNELLGEDLQYIAKRLNSIMEESLKISTQELNQRVDDAHKGSAAILEAILYKE